MKAIKNIDATPALKILFIVSPFIALVPDGAGILYSFGSRSQKRFWSRGKSKTLIVSPRQQPANPARSLVVKASLHELFWMLRPSVRRNALEQSR
jgi:hypothetical protein